MTTKEQISLRARLRVDTRASHEDLDRKVSRFDLTTLEDLLRFLRMHSMALRSIGPYANCSVSSEALLDLLERAESDLRKFETPAQPVARISEPLHPQSIDYVIAGSRLGTQILKKRWLAATDLRVRQVDAYFSAPSYIKTWTSFCSTAEAMPPNGPLADQIVRDADRIFELYYECAGAHQVAKGPINV